MGRLALSKLTDNPWVGFLVLERQLVLVACCLAAVGLFSPMGC